MRETWPNVRIESLPLDARRVSVGDPLDLHAKVWLQGLKPEDVVVEAVIGEQSADADIHNPMVRPLHPSGAEGDTHTFR